MASRPRLVSPRLLVGVALEFLPWIGLAAGFLWIPASAVPSLVPHPHLILPLLTLGVGVASVLSRRQVAPFILTEAPADDRAGSALAPVASSADSSDHLRQHQSRDALTGLADRTRLLSKLSECLTRDEPAPPPEQGPALVIVRTAEYRDVTESFGHQAGLDLLTTVATRIADVPPPTATTARIGEDTFAILLPRTSEKQARVVSEELLNAFESPFTISGNQVPIEVSIGLATRSSSEASFESAEKMLQAAYSAMHQVHRQEGDNFNVYQNGNQDGTHWLQRRERLRRAIREDELTLHYQPIVHLVSGEPVGAEALVRWNHPDRGLLSPAAFIPLAEESGLIGELDRWVFNQALAHAREWTDGSNSILDWVSVNVSPQSVEGDLQTWCRQKLRDASLPDGGLHLEITERWALRDEQPLQPLRDEGVRLSIDDFGTGYSSLRYLRSLNADVLKIDREFVQDLGRDEKTTAIVQFLMNLSLRLDVEVIAEGVETEEQEHILRELGCAMAQGYHFSRPIPAERLAEKAHSNASSAAENALFPA